MSWDFLLTSLIVVLLPGTGVIYTLSVGMFRGAWASVAAAFGCTLGIVPHIAASILGLAALLHASAVAFQVVKYAGVVYLLYLAWSVWRDTGALNLPRPEPMATTKTIVRGFLINILNPKLSVFFLSFLPQFVPLGSAHATRDMLVLAAVFMAMTFVVFVGYGVSATAVGARLAGSPRATRWMQRSFAAALAAFGVKLALQER